MITRKITNKLTYKDKIDDEAYLTTTEYNRKIYLWGIMLVDHSFKEDQISNIKDVTTNKSIGFTKPNKNSQN